MQTKYPHKLIGIVIHDQLLGLCQIQNILAEISEWFSHFIFYQLITVSFYL